METSKMGQAKDFKTFTEARQTPVPWEKWCASLANHASNHGWLPRHFSLFSAILRITWRFSAR